MRFPLPIGERSLAPAIILLLGLALSACANGGAASTWGGLASDGETAYLAFAQHVYAVDVASGRELWRYPAEAQRNLTFYAPPAVAGDAIVVGGFDGNIYSLRASDGGLRWSMDHPQDRIVGGAALDGELAFVPSADGALYALRLDSGALVWKFETRHPLWGTPSVAEGVVYLGSLDHHVYALDRDTGLLLWSRDLGGAIADTPTLTDGLLLVGTFGQKLFALDRADGQVLWSVDTEGWVWGNPALADRAAFFGDVNGVVYAIELNGGEERWRVQPDGPVAATPAILEDRVYVGTASGTVYAYSVTGGVPVWQQPFPDRKAYTEPLVVDDTLLVAWMGGDALLTAMDAASGAIRWSFTPAR
jgi:outer membrane protein assembly factor BamB